MMRILSSYQRSGVQRSRSCKIPGCGVCSSSAIQIYPCMHRLYCHGPNLITLHCYGNNTLEPIRMIDHLQHSPIEADDDMADFQLIEIESAWGILDYDLDVGTRPEDCCLT